MRLLRLKKKDIKAYNDRIQSKKIKKEARRYIDDILDDGNPATDVMLNQVCHEYNKRNL